MSSQLRGVGERVIPYIRIRKRETPELRLSGVSSTAAAAPNSESATSNFIVLRARCRRCVADTTRKRAAVERRTRATRFNPNAIDTGRRSGGGRGFYRDFRPAVGGRGTYRSLGLFYLTKINETRIVKLR